jgi:DNA-binding FadR family transcriptional regulator
MADEDASLGLGNSRGRNLTFGMLDAVGRAIVIGEYQGAQFPTEADLGKQYGVSRTVTREALKMLAAKGMLNARPKQGTFVEPQEQWNLFDTDILRWLLDRKVSAKLLRQFNELRIGVEPRAAALAAQRARPAQVASIAAGLNRMRVAEKGFDDALEADIAFHVAVLNASCNPFYAQFKDIVATALRTSIRFTNRVAGRTASIDDHAAVYSAIAAGDENKAHAMMQNLIDEVLRLLGDSATDEILD